MKLVFHAEKMKSFVTRQLNRSVRTHRTCLNPDSGQAPRMNTNPHEPEPISGAVRHPCCAGVQPSLGALLYWLRQAEACTPASARTRNATRTRARSSLRESAPRSKSPGDAAQRSQGQARQLFELRPLAVPRLFLLIQAFGQGDLCRPAADAEISPEATADKSNTDHRQEVMKVW